MRPQVVMGTCLITTIDSNIILVNQTFQHGIGKVYALVLYQNNIFLFGAKTKDLPIMTFGLNI